MLEAIAESETKSINADMQAAQIVTSGMMMEDAFENYRKERNDWKIDLEMEDNIELELFI